MRLVYVGSCIKKHGRTSLWSTRQQLHQTSDMTSAPCLRANEKYYSGSALARFTHCLMHLTVLFVFLPSGSSATTSTPSRTATNEKHGPNVGIRNQLASISRHGRPALYGSEESSSHVPVITFWQSAKMRYRGKQGVSLISELKKSRARLGRLQKALPIAMESEKCNKRKMQKTRDVHQIIRSAMQCNEKMDSNKLFKVLQKRCDDLPYITKKRNYCRRNRKKGQRYSCKREVWKELVASVKLSKHACKRVQQFEAKYGKCEKVSVLRSELSSVKRHKCRTTMTTRVLKKLIRKTKMEIRWLLEALYPKPSNEPTKW